MSKTEAASPAAGEPLRGGVGSGESLPRSAGCFSHRPRQPCTRAGSHSKIQLILQSEPLRGWGSRGLILQNFSRFLSVTAVPAKTRVGSYFKKSVHSSSVTAGPEDDREARASKNSVGFESKRHVGWTSRWLALQKIQLALSRNAMSDGHHEGSTSDFQLHLKRHLGCVSGGCPVCRQGAPVCRLSVPSAIRALRTALPACGPFRTVPPSACRGPHHRGRRCKDTT